MPELDLAPAPPADEEKSGTRDVSVTAFAGPLSDERRSGEPDSDERPSAVRGEAPSDDSASDDSASDEAETVRPPSSRELTLDDEAPDTVRRPVVPGPEAIGGARRESGVQPVSVRSSDDEGEAELSELELQPAAAAAPDIDVPAEGEATVEAAAAEAIAATAVDGEAAASEPSPEPPAAAVEPTEASPAEAAAAEPEAAVPEAAAPEAAALAAAVEAPIAEEAIAEQPTAEQPTAEQPTAAAPLVESAPSDAEPTPSEPVATDGEGAAADVAVTEPVASEPSVAADSDDFAHEVLPGWIEEGASDDDAASPTPFVPIDDDGDVVEEVQASWFEQSGELEESELAAAPSAEALAADAAAGDPDEITAGWIEQGDAGDERTTPSVPLPAVREPIQPWIDEEADPVTPHDRGRVSSLQLSDLPLAEDLRGRVLANRFLAEEIAERSAASITYSAYHLALDSPVTVQILPRGLACFGEAAELVRQTAVTASMIGSAHIARTLDFGVFGSKDPGNASGWPYWVAEHVEGKSLARLLNEEGKLTLRRVLALAKQIAAGLAAAHAAGILHGHLKPDCLIVVEPGSRAEVVRILGFGLMHASGGQLAPPSSSVFGVPFYVSPEQAACRPCDERTDLYALGAILYELMTGRPPFTGGDFAAVLCQHLDDEPPSPAELLDLTTAIARGLDGIVLRCLAKDPEQRFSSAAELVEELVGLEQSIGSGKRRPMPEIARPTAMIHSPAPRAESNAPPAPKVIVSAELEAEAVPGSAAQRGTSSVPPQDAPVPDEQPGGARSSRPPQAPASGAPGESSGWWGRLIGRVSSGVRRPS